MIILFDVGNTETKIGFSNDKLTIAKVIRLETDSTRSSEIYFQTIKEMFEAEISDITICSVVPKVTRILEKLSVDYFKVKPLIIKPGVKTGLKMLVDNPKEVGSDLIADCVGGSLEADEAIIIDLGTANKLMYVKNHTLFGVIIAPGVISSLNSLVKNTALLPDIEIAKPKKVLGTDTITSMQAGLIYGTSSLVDGLIEKIKEEVKSDNPKMIITGGLSKTIAPLSKYNLEIDELLTLKGILKIYQLNK